MALREVSFYEIRTSGNKRLPDTSWGKVFFPTIKAVNTATKKANGPLINEYQQAVNDSTDPNSVDPPDLDVSNQMEYRREQHIGDHHSEGLAGTPIISLARIRMKDLPRKYSGGQEVSLGLLPNEGLAERTYAGFFPGNVMAVLQSPGSPPAQAIAKYLNEVCEANPRLRLEQLYDEPTVTRLAAVGSQGLRVGQFKPRPGADLSVLEPRSARIREAIRFAEQQLVGVEIGFNVRAITDDDGNVSEEASQTLEQLSNAIQEHPEVFAAASMVFEPPGMSRERVSIINPELGMKYPVDLEDEGRSRSVTLSSATKALVETHKVLRENIKRALDMQFTPATIKK